MTAAAQRISEDNLGERLAVPGPGDELKDLGDTIDGLLDRLEGAFTARAGRRWPRAATSPGCPLIPKRSPGLDGAVPAMSNGAARSQSVPSSVTSARCRVSM
jgi:hypothetical protein